MAILNVVTGYGAVGNGVTDDTTSIQNALNAAVNGDTVYFPTGTYLVNILTSSTTGVTLSGDGFTLSIIKKKITGSTNAPVIAFSGVSNCTVTALAFDGQGISQSYWIANPYAADGVVFADNIRFTGGTNNTVSSVYSHAAGSAGIRYVGSTNGHVTSCTGDNNGFGTVVVYDNAGAGSTGIVIDSNTISLDYCDGIRAVTSTGFTISNNIIHDIRTVAGAPDQFAGIYVYQATSGTISGNTCYSNSNRGIDFDTGGTGTSGVSVTGNTCYSNGKDGILLGSSGLTIANNTCYDNKNGGINCRGTGHVLTGNTCRAVNSLQNYGIFEDVTIPTNLTLANNDLRGNSIAPVQAAIRTSSGYSETGNRFVVSGATDKPTSFVYISLVGDAAANDILSYGPRVGDKNWTMTKPLSGLAILASNSVGTATQEANGTNNTESHYVFDTVAPFGTIVITCTVFYNTSSTADTYFEFFLAYASETNYLRVTVQIGANIKLNLDKMVAGVFTGSVVTPGNTLSNAANTLTITTTPSAVTVAWNGVNQFTGFAVPGGLAISGNKVGLGVYYGPAGVSASAIYNYQATAAALVAAPLFPLVNNPVPAMIRR